MSADEAAPEEQQPKKKETPPELATAMDELVAKHAEAVEERLDEIDEIVCAVLTEFCDDTDACVAAVRGLRKKFADWNEVRVARVAEIARALDHLGDGDMMARRIRELLMRIFDNAGRVSLDYMADMKPGDARRALMQIEPVDRDTANRILMMVVPGATVPFSTEAVQVARKMGVVPKNATRQKFQKLVSDSLEVEQIPVFYAAIEAEATQKGGRKSKTSSGKKKSSGKKSSGGKKKSTARKASKKKSGSKKSSSKKKKSGGSSKKS